MPIDLDIDADLLREAQRLSGTSAASETVDLALRLLVARHRQAAVLDLRGRVRWEGDLDASRSARASNT